MALAGTSGAHSRLRCVVAIAILAVGSAEAGPPYVSDDPEPTDRGHYEIYAFTTGSDGDSGTSTATGIDFNYGAARDLQLTAVLPFVQNEPDGAATSRGIGNVELAAKYKFLHQADAGLDVAFFPRVFLPTRSALGPSHVSLLLPIWAQHSWQRWTAFGGGGCELNRGGDSRDFCTMGLAVTNQIAEALQIGAEIYHRTPDAADARASTGLGVGAIYDIDKSFHLMASAGPGIQNPVQTYRTAWYLALLMTF